jgi:uncharacterized protein (TIGR02145 family)
LFPLLLPAQGSLTVSGLQVTAGLPTTVTFDVRWDKNAMPAVWSNCDSVWVFVDYNDNFRMKRLPLLPGATLTASEPGGGRVVQYDGNEQGVWVVGNLSASAFSATVQLLSDIPAIGACAYASPPPMGRYVGATTHVSFTGSPAYELVVDAGGSTYTGYSNSSYTLPAGHTVKSFFDATGAPGTMLLGSPQGGCTFTPPPLVGTFATFPSDYSASTYVTLTDERDSNNYTVVKISNRWIMAQNLNYQKDLTWQEYSNSPSTYYSGACTACIGHFWCPGGYSETAATSNRASCDVWGALYTWETAMMVDGKWTSDTHASSTWSEPASYGTNTTSGNTQNHGRAGSGAVTDGRGICPPNWHVPTDGEWGSILNAMESGSGTTHNTSTGYRGEDAGKRGKAVCTVSDNTTAGDTYVKDNLANWYYNSSTLGTDFYGFRVLPAGRRNYGGSSYSTRGSNAFFWSASANISTMAGVRIYNSSLANVYRGNYNRSYGLSVRCIRD